MLKTMLGKKVKKSRKIFLNKKKVYTFVQNLNK